MHMAASAHFHGGDLRADDLGTDPVLQGPNISRGRYRSPFRVLFGMLMPLCK